MEKMLDGLNFDKSGGDVPKFDPDVGGPDPATRDASEMEEVLDEDKMEL